MSVPYSRLQSAALYMLRRAVGFRPCLPKLLNDDPKFRAEEASAIPT